MQKGTECKSGLQLYSDVLGVVEFLHHNSINIEHFTAAMQVF